MKEQTCAICKNTFPVDQLVSGHGIRHEIEELIQKSFPDWNDTSLICKADLNSFRIGYVVKVIEEEKGSIEALEHAVIDSIKNNEIITFNNRAEQEPLKFGDQLSDKIASFGGSWNFIILFFLILLIWMTLNSLVFLFKPFDPYPFILLNLVLSCLAAIQAPIIMMSQNRQETKDRKRAENDYKINLKSEIEIRTLHEKVDHLLLDQWSKMMRIQEIQIEILEEIRTKVENK